MKSLFRHFTAISIFGVFLLLLPSCGATPAGDDLLAEALEQPSTKVSIERVPAHDFAVRIGGGGVNGVQVVDVRTPREFNSGHIEGAILMDISKRDVFNNLIASLDKNRPVLVYCAVGGRSAAAAELLAQKGFSQIVDLDGGIDAWVRAGKQTVR